MYPHNYNFLRYELQMSRMWVLSEPGGTSGSNSVREEISTTNATPTGCTFGQAGICFDDPHSAVLLNGTSDLIDTELDNPLDLTGDLTIIVAFIVPDLLGTGHMISKNPTGGNTYPFQFALTSSGQLRFVHRGAGGSDTIDSTSLIRANVPCHVAVVRDATAETITFYIDGVVDSAGAQSYLQTPTASTVTAKIGSRGDGGASFFNGRLQYIAIKNAALTASQITLAHNYFAGRNL